MYCILYDRNFNSFENAFIVESLKWVRRAYDLDDINVVCEEINVSTEPFFVVIKEDTGQTIVSGLASTPNITTNNGKSTIIVKDLLTLFNTDIILLGAGLNNFDQFISRVLTDFNRFNFNLPNITINFNSNLSDVVVNDVLPNHDTYYNAKNIILSLLLIKDLYYNYSIDIKTKTLIFNFYKSGTITKNIKLADFFNTEIKKQFGDINQVRIYVRGETATSRAIYSLGIDNNIYTGELTGNANRLYPVKNKIFFANSSSTQDINTAKIDALTELAKRRYQENVNIEISDNFNLERFKNITFSTRFQVINNENLIYKTLPLGEIEVQRNNTNNLDKLILRCGYRQRLLTQIL